MEQLTEREQEILRLLRAEPMIPQEELAARLQISRSAIAVHISNLMKKRAILGRGYVFNESSGIVVWGSTELCILAQASSPDIKARQSSISLFTAGTGFLLARSMAAADIPATLVTILGRDETGYRTIEELQKLGVDCRHVLHTSRFPTAKRIEIADANGETLYQIDEAGAMQVMAPEYVKEKQQVIARAQAILLDGRLPEPTLNAVLSAAQENSVPSLLLVRAADTCEVNLSTAATVIIKTGDRIVRKDDRAMDMDFIFALTEKYIKKGAGACVAWCSGQGAVLATADEKTFIPWIPSAGEIATPSIYTFAGILAYARTKGYHWRQAVRRGLDPSQGKAKIYSSSDA